MKEESRIPVWKKRHYQYRRREPFSEERFIIRDHGKIQEKRSIVHIVLNVLLCAILFYCIFFLHIGRPYARFDADGCGDSVPERFFLCDALGHGGKYSSPCTPVSFLPSHDLPLCLCGAFLDARK
ncbi:hypothetical protein EI42_01693 [Thermosporothrix hazakensis]|uniref:Uncharacterized protein n=1 Tax=Thermosporothrix hazakensis TaxID=644383 RepID=A0A326U904_THEHA|nr:hypothetical protein EI42_01693 [Thermosporothrix hazakensis]